ncbi:hypothetical protein evm_010015 [Chilo suppressalis]|nr:hypothetical protein evm_010015 [Chilo suppressalis]
MNPYEEQLYTVFKTFDVDNEEALDKSAVLDLCDALQLEDRGAALVDTLFERRADRVTFTQFRNGLLSVLSGPERGDTAAPVPTPESPSEKGPAPAFVAPHSDEDSSGREVAPKFVFGSKKYGRRSRPQRSLSASGGSPRAASVSRLDSEDRNRTSQRMRCRRSASAMESRDLDSTNDGEDVALDDFDHDRRIDCDQALALCRNLRMDGIDRNLLEAIFGDSQTKELTVGDFFDRLNASLTSSIEGSRPAGCAVALVDEGSDEESGVASELVVDAWERAGVPRPRRLLLELGFAVAALRPQDLERALDDELAALPEPLGERRDARATLLAAALALGRLRTARARRRADLAAAERDKLRADVAEANKRADLLAHDVDESHARMEAELAANLRRAEARHAEAARRAADEAGAERERAAAARARLEAEAARRAEAEARARADADAERGRAARLEARALAAEERAAAAEREAARLTEEARRARHAGSGAGSDGSPAGSGAAAGLAALVESLRREASALRDRNDELEALLEARAPIAASTAHSGDLSAELRSLMAPEPLEECDSAPVSMEPKITIDHLEAAKRLRAIFQSVRTLSPASGGKCDSCVATESIVLEICARVQELSEAVVIGNATINTDEGTEAAVSAHSSTQTDSNAVVESLTQTEPLSMPTEISTVVVDVDRGAADSQEKELALVVRKYEDEKRKDDETIRELEASLEQMRDEYERCEEYWARKLDDERAAHDRERRAGDERLAELLARVADYERSFAGGRAPTLPPIEERAALEAQAADAERELAECRARAAGELRARDDELRRLRAQVAHAQAQAMQTPACLWCGGGGGGGVGGLEAWVSRQASVLRARAGRAEAAVRRLTARLHAADLLVKDLYLENCHLAHRRAP